MFVVEHFLFLAAGAAAFLAAFLFAFLLGGGFDAVFGFEDAFGEGAAGEPAVDFAGAVFAAFDLGAGGAVEKADDGGSLVGFLSARAAAEDERFLEVGLEDVGGSHEGFDAGDCFRCNHLWYNSGL